MVIDMKKIAILLFSILLGTIPTIAQVAINSDSSAPDNSALLDIKSTTKGLLLPRLTTLQISAITSPAEGLIVFNSDSSDFYGYKGNRWVSMWNIADTLDNWYCGNQITDSRDSQIYGTVQIGTQCWMTENMNIGIMINSTSGGTNSDGNQTDNGTIEKHCYLDNITINRCDIYGGLYQWDEMMQYVLTEGCQGICPTGWHLPTDEEWKTMEMALGMSQSEADALYFRGTNEGEKMKSISGWYNNGNGTNSSGLNILPGGRLFSGSFIDQWIWGELWSTTLYSDDYAHNRGLTHNYDQVYRQGGHKTESLNVRCIKD